MWILNRHAEEKRDAEDNLAIVEAEQQEIENKIESVLNTIKEKSEKLKQTMEVELEDMVSAVDQTEKEINELEELTDVVAYMEEGGIEFAENLVHEWASWKVFLFRFESEVSDKIHPAIFLITN